MLQMLGISLVVVGGLFSFFRDAPMGLVGATTASAAILLLTLVLLIANSWIPWGVAHFASCRSCSTLGDSGGSSRCSLGP